MVKLRVIAGSHRIGPTFKRDEEGNIAKDENGNPIMDNTTQPRNVKRGEVFESSKDLSTIFPEKYQRLDVEEALTEVKTQSNQSNSNTDNSAYAELTKEELLALAKEYELDIPSNANKATIIQKLVEFENQ